MPNVPLIVFSPHAIAVPAAAESVTRELKEWVLDIPISVSYTHLTLPTKRIV